MYTSAGIELGLSEMKANSLTATSILQIVYFVFLLKNLHLLLVFL